MLVRMMLAPGIIVLIVKRSRLRLIPRNQDLDDFNIK